MSRRASGSSRVIRGVSWLSGPRHTRIAYRTEVDLGDCGDIFGLRLMRRAP